MIITILLILFLLVTILIFAIFYIDKLSKTKEIVLKFFKILTENLYLFLLPFPIIYLFFYQFYYLPNLQTLKNSANEIPFFCRSDVAEYLKSISIIFFSGGIFSATIKLINSLIIFKKNFQKVILSEDFDILLKDKFQILALSDDFLLNRRDIHEIWSRVTTCQFEQAFPELKNSIVKKIENDFFNDKMLTYYYNNFRIQINLELIENGIIKITEVSNFEVKSRSIDPVNIDFKISSSSNDNEDVYTKLIKEDCKLNNEIINLAESNISSEKSNVKIFSTTLEGSLSYLIERKVEMTQYLDEDRVFSFSSSIIIDNMTVDIKLCSKLDMFFSVVGKNKFSSDNHLGVHKSLISREVLLPGEKFKIFIFRKG